MQDPAKTNAIRALITIAVWEGLVLVAVVGPYFVTNSVPVLIAGLAASMALFAPMFLRWAKAHGAALKPKPNSDEAADGR